MQHYAIYLRAFGFDIQYKKSKLHANADAMSRLPENSEDLNTETLDTADLFEINQIEALKINIFRLAAETKEGENLKPLAQALNLG